MAPLLLAGLLSSISSLGGDAGVIGRAPLRPREERGEIPEEARIADYQLEVSLDAERHELRGAVTVTWRNRGREAVSSLPFHLYMNAFRGEQTAWMRESRGAHRGVSQSGESPWGYIDVQTARLADSGEALRWTFGDDPTLMTVLLPRPIAPGEQVAVALEFLTKLPRVFARTGHAGDFHMVGQWYPKIGVLDPERGWQAHVFTLNSEFFADFGDYDVSIEVPQRFVVGASGALVAEEALGEGRRRLRYRAEMVHDFAWAADPRFVERLVEWRGVLLRQLIFPERVGDAQAHFDAAIATLESMDARFGAYPWSTLTIIHVPEDAGGAGGMEYPTLFTTSDIAERSLWWAIFGLDERISGILTTVHELGHQYFQGLLASDEHREPWLDEGMNTFANGMVFADWHGPSAWVARLGGQAISEPELVRLSLLRGADLDPVASPADAFLEVTGGYGVTVYRKTAAIMHTLRALAGADAFDEALRAYALRWRFRHPRGEDLEDALIEGLGATLTFPSGSAAGPVHMDVARFLEQALRSVDVLDFGISRVENRRRIGDAGWRVDEEGDLVETPRPETWPKLTALADAEIEGVVVVERRGAMRLPVELEVEDVHGEAQRLTWDGQDRYRVFVFPGRRLRRAELDPDHKLVLEPRRLDNLRYAADQPAPKGLTEPLGDAAEAIALAVLAGVAL